MRNEILLGDCLDIMPEIEEKTVDLIILDPPYNIGKDSWDKIDNYLDWMKLVFLECQRVLKDNGSFYWFHNDFETVCDLRNVVKNSTRFIFKQLIVWNKRFDGCKDKGFLDGFIGTAQLRNYQKMVEYLLFYTFQDETGLTTVMLDTNNFTALRQYFKDFQGALNLSLREINKRLGHRKAEHAFYWNSSQWDMPTEETYLELCKLPLKYGFVRKEYEDLRKEYEDLRYTFNNQKTHHSVWNYDIPTKNGHPTQKPLALIENIIKHSSSENDLILDCMMGSGTTCIACIETGRDYIGIEKDEGYYQVAKDRIEQRLQQPFLLEIETPSENGKQLQLDIA